MTLATHGETGFAIAGEIGRVPAFPQRALQELGGLTIIFHYEYTHRAHRG
jgi:hypothetical protein